MDTDNVFYLVKYPGVDGGPVRIEVSEAKLGVANSDSQEAAGHQRMIYSQYRAHAGRRTVPHKLDWPTFYENMKPDTAQGKQSAAKAVTGRRARNRPLSVSAPTSPPKPGDIYRSVPEGSCRCQCFDCDMRDVHCCVRTTGCKKSQP